MATWKWIQPLNSDAPPLVRRYQRRMAWAFGAYVFLVLPVYSLVLLKAGKLPGPSWLTSLGFYMPIYITIGVGAITWRRIIRRVRAAGGYACSNCLYDVSSLPDAEGCPECGYPGNAERMRQQWRRSNVLK